MRMAFLLVGLCVCLGGLLIEAAPARQTLSLNGPWRIQTSTEKLVWPPSEVWEETPIQIPSPWNVNRFTNGRGGDFNFFPSYPKHWEEAQAAWHQRQVTAPQAWTGDTWLHFEASFYHTIVYVNGVLVGEDWDGFLPFEFNLGGQAGQTLDIVVGVEHHWLYQVKYDERFYSQLAAPFGSFFTIELAGIWQDVRLEHRPRTWLNDLAVSTSVQDVTAGFSVALKGEPSPGLEVAFEVREATQDPMDSPLFTLNCAAQETTSPPGSWTAAAATNWPQARVWSPEDPHLYTLTARLLSAAVELDAATTRFGFREFRILNGQQFLLNGQPRPLRGDSWHFLGVPVQNERYARDWCRLCKAHHLNCVRLTSQPHPSYYLDIADEEGLMVIDESALWASGYAVDLQSPQTWSRLAEQWRRLVLRDRNHPSLVLWSLANETGPVGFSNPNAWGWIDPSYAQYFGPLRELVLSLDSSRPVYAEGDMGGAQVMDIFSFHYSGWLMDVGTAEAWRNGVQAPSGKVLPSMIGELGNLYCSLPTLSAYFSGPGVYNDPAGFIQGIADDLALTLENGRIWAQGVFPFNLVWYSLKSQPYAGLPRQYADPSAPNPKPERIGPYISGLNAGYDDALGAYQPEPMAEVINRVLAPIAIAVMEKATRFWGGAQILKHLYVFNHEPVDNTFTLSWQLRHGETVIWGASLTQPIPGGVTYKVPDEFGAIVLPAVSQVEDWTWDLYLLNEAGQVAATQAMTLRLFPHNAPPPPIDGPTVGFYDPQQGLDWLRNHWGITQWRHLDQPVPTMEDQPAVLLIGPKAGVSATQIAQLRERVRHGLRIVAFEGNAEFFPGAVVNTNNNFVFAQDLQHPVFAGLEASDLRMWGDRYIPGQEVPLEVAGQYYATIAAPGIEPVAGTGNGHPVLLETQVNTGYLAVSLMNLAGKAEVAPPAAILAGNLIEHALTVETTASLKPVVVIAEEDSLLPGFFKSLGIPFLTASAAQLTAGTPSLAVVDAGRPVSGETAVRVSAWAQAGATVILSGLTGETAPVWQTVIPDGFEIVPATLPNLAVGTPAYPGLFFSEDDLYWLDYNNAFWGQFLPVVISGLRWQTPQVSRYDLINAPVIDWREFVNSGEPEKTGALQRAIVAPPAPFSALSIFPLGSGALVVSQLRTDTVVDRNRRLWWELLGGLGARFDPLALPCDLSQDGQVDWRDLFLYARQHAHPAVWE